MSATAGLPRLDTRNPIIARNPAESVLHRLTYLEQRRDHFAAELNDNPLSLPASHPWLRQQLEEIDRRLETLRRDYRRALRP